MEEKKTIEMEDPDYTSEGREVEVRLLRAIALGAHTSAEIKLLLDSQQEGGADFQALALALSNLSVSGSKAQKTFEHLQAHQERLSRRLQRPVGIKSAALDLLENVETALRLEEEEQALTYNQLVQMAFYDALTGLPNYRSLSSRLADEMRRAERYRHLLSFVMLDLDHFKKFNDSFGHPGGNEALEQLARLLTGQVRDTDLVGRFGGEEFALILPETTKREAMELAERIRHAVEMEPIALEEFGPQKITVSLGVATYPRDAGNLEELLAAADEALYAAKSAGRNQCRAYVPETKVTLFFLPSNPVSTHSLHVVGDFNDWESGVDVMTKASDGRFSLDLALAPGRYEYKFLVNNDWYVADPACAESVQDGYGGRNSVLFVHEKPGK